MCCNMNLTMTESKVKISELFARVAMNRTVF